MNKKRKINVQKLFCAISLILILVLIVYCGLRIIKSYKVYNRELIAETITYNKTIERDGKTYIFRGSNSSNYIVVSNMLFRIIKTNVDGTVDIILNDDINTLEYNSNTTYTDSDVHKYLNDVFLSRIDTKYLTKTIICNDLVSDINNYSCNNKNSNSYVKLLDVADYLNSFDEDTYIPSNEIMWLSTMKDKENTWVVSNGKIGYLENTSRAAIRPVVTLKNSLEIASGTGTLDDPYTVTETNSIGVGSYVKIDNDLWIVFAKDRKNIKLVLNNNINSGVTKFKYSDGSLKFDKNDEKTLAYYLNNTYYDSLSYKKLLREFEICTGEYDGNYSTVCSSKSKVKVGVPTILDLKFKGNNYEYYLANGKQDKVYYYDSGIYLSQTNLIKPIRPTISIKTPKTKEGKGTYNDPYIVEVK